MGALKDLPIERWINKHNCKIFVESGLGYGTGIMRAISPEFPFELLISIEIDKQTVEHLSQTFRFDTRVRLFNAIGVDGLQSILPQLPLNVPVFFWLDSHFLHSDVIPINGEMTKHSDGEPDIRLPLLKELELVKSLRIDKGAKDVIVCDDLMLYDNRDIYDDNVARLGENAVPEEYRNHLPRFLELFQKTHKSYINKAAQGTLILEPL